MPLPMPASTGLREERVQDETGGSNHESRRNKRIAEDSIRARQVRPLAAQDNHRKRRQGVEDPAGEDDKGKKLLIGAQKHEENRPRSLEEQRKVRGPKLGMNIAAPAKEEAISGHSVVDSRACQDHSVHAP